MTGFRAGVEAGAQASKTVLKIRCKSSLEYLKTSVVVVGVTVMEDFAPKNQASCLKNSDLGDREESRGASKE